MELLDKLPTEVVLLILESFRDFNEAANLSRGSSVLSQVFRQYRTSILLHYVKETLDEDLMQDALAILLFPDAYGHGVTDMRSHIDSVVAHLRQWGGKKFANPLHDPANHWKHLKELSSMIGRLWLYVDDYVSKSTSDYLPRAYRRLPIWTLTLTSPMQAQLQMEVNNVDRDSLSRHQKRRIMQAFLRYELLCLVYGQTRDNMFGHWFDAWISPENQYPFRYWDWRLLSTYEGSDPKSLDMQLLPCVREYVQSLYGAILMDCARVKLPFPENEGRGDWENYPSVRSTVPPEGSPADGAGRAHVVPRSSRTWSHSAISLLASAGFGTLTRMLREPDPRTRWCIINNEGRLFNRPFVNATNINLPTDAPMENDRASWHPNNFIRLYRQRAWPLFGEGDRPQGPRLPTEAEYTIAYGPGPPCLWGVQDGWAPESENEWICHGREVQAYIGPDGRIPFWRVG